MNNPSKMGASTTVGERRAQSRRRPTSLSYIEMGEQNGGLILNLSENGATVQCALAVTKEHLTRIRFQLPPTWDWVSASGRLEWLSRSRKEAGITFVDLPESARAKIRKWIASDGADANDATNEIVEEKAAVWDEGRRLVENPPNNLSSSYLSTPEAESTSSRTTASIEAQKAEVEDFWAPLPPGPIVETTVAASPRALPTPPSTRVEQAASFSVPLQPAAREAFVPERSRPAATAGLPSILQINELKSAAVETETKNKGGWKMAIAIGISAAISLPIGVGIGNGAFGRWWHDRGEILGKANVATQSEVETASAIPLTADLNSRALDATQNLMDENPKADNTPPFTSPVPIDSRAGESANNVAMKAQPGYGDSLTLPADQPQNGILVSAPEPGAPSIRLRMPQKALGASSSIAVSSQRSLVVPPATRGGAAQRTERLQIGDLSLFVEPVYPPEAKQRQEEGAVQLRATISREGVVRSITPVSGVPIFTQAVMAAVGAWHYRPTLLGGEPVETDEDITVLFRLP